MKVVCVAHATWLTSNYKNKKKNANYINLLNYESKLNVSSCHIILHTYYLIIVPVRNAVSNIIESNRNNKRITNSNELLQDIYIRLG